MNNSCLLVYLGRKGTNSFSSIACTHQAISSEVECSALSALFDKILDRNWLDDWTLAKRALLFCGIFLRRVYGKTMCICRDLLGLGDGQRKLGGPITKMCMLQGAYIFTNSME